MRLEKREITLNESDSIKDVFFMEKTLLNGYTEALERMSRKEMRNEILNLIKEAGEEMCFLQDLMRKSEKE